MAFKKFKVTAKTQDIAMAATSVVGGVATGLITWSVLRNMTTGYWDVAANPEAVEVTTTVYDGVTYYYSIVKASVFSKLIMGLFIIGTGISSCSSRTFNR